MTTPAAGAPKTLRVGLVARVHSLDPRQARDLAERGRTVQDVLRQYQESVRPMHLEFVEPSKRYADLIVPEGAQNEVALDAVEARVNAMLRVSAGPRRA